MVRRYLAIVFVIVFGLAVFAPAAGASPPTSPAVYIAKLNVVVPPPSTGTTIGHAVVVRAGQDDRWVGGVHTHGLPAGNYSFALLIGTDFNGDGSPDGFSFFNLCTFSASGTGSAGCTATNVSLGRTDLGPFASAQVVQTGIATFLKATGPLRPVA